MEATIMCYIGYIEYGVYGDLIMIYPKPYSIYLRGAINPQPEPVSGRGTVAKILMNILLKKSLGRPAPAKTDWRVAGKKKEI